jgi:glycosyltransferase involved in cell wall biosynthesis
MKIAIIPGGNFKYNKGGSELQCQQLGRKFSELDFEVFFINTVDNNSNIPYKEHYYSFYMYNVNRSKILEFNFSKYLKILSKEKPTIIYSRILKWQPYILIIAKILEIPVVYNISDDLCLKKKLLDIFNILKNNFSFKYTNQIIAQTKYQQNLLEKNYNKSSIVIPNGHFIPNPPFKKCEKNIVSWIANIKPWKQPEIFIKLAEKFQDFDVKFLYAGRPANRNYQQMLERETKKLNNIEYLGEISFDKTNELLSKSSIFVNTSLPFEGFPNTFIQAWLRETPVVTLHFDPDEIIKKQKIGFHSINFNQLIRDIKFLINDPNKRIEFGKKARRFAIENHNIEKISNKYINIFMKFSN